MMEIAACFSVVPLSKSLRLGKSLLGSFSRITLAALSFYQFRYFVLLKGKILLSQSAVNRMFMVDVQCLTDDVTVLRLFIL